MSKHNLWKGYKNLTMVVPLEIRTQGLEENKRRQTCFIIFAHYYIYYLLKT